MLARENPLIVNITTAGYERDSIAFEVYERMLRGDALDAEGNRYTDEGRSLLWWLGAVDGEDTADPAVWARANPAPWLTEAILGREFRRLPRAVFERLHLNLWTRTEQLWLPPGAWDRLRSDLRIQPGERVWLGVDIGFKRDASAVVMVARRDGEGPAGEPLYVAQAFIFEPAMRPDGSLDLGPVERKIRELAAAQRVVECRYDRTLFQRSAEDLSELVRMVEIPWASNQRVVEMSQALYEVIVEAALVHDGDVLFKSHVEAAVVRETESGWRVSKAKSRRRMDALAALLMAIGGAVDRRQRAEPGARFIDTTRTTSSSATSKPGARLTDAMARKAVAKVYAGGIVECTADEYRAVVRGALQTFAGESADAGDDLRARLALYEVKRLDAVHGFEL